MKLGDLGEVNFAGLFTTVDEVVANKSRDDDAAGWDFTVDLGRQQAQSDVLRWTLDTLPPPISCRIQVKTIWNDNDEIKLKLSTLDLLAN